MTLTDQARKLYGLLGRLGAGPKGMVPYESYSYGLTEPPVLLSPMFMRDRRPVDNGDAAELIEHAAIVWLMGRGWCLSTLDNSAYLWKRGEVNADLYDCEADTLAEALLSAVKREFEGA